MMRFFDYFFFVEISNRINYNLKYIVDEISKNEYVEIIGDPILNIVAVRSKYGNKINERKRLEII